MVKPNQEDPPIIEVLLEEAQIRYRIVEVTVEVVIKQQKFLVSKDTIEGTQ